MKKKILFVAGLLCMAVSFHSCDELSNCEICRKVTTDNSTGAIIDESSEAEYCDAELIGIKATPPATVLNKTTKWECR